MCRRPGKAVADDDKADGNSGKAESGAGKNAVTRPQDLTHYPAPIGLFRGLDAKYRQDFLKTD